MHLRDYDYVLPEELIAQEPLEKRDNSRLLTVDKQTGSIDHRKFFEIIDLLREDDLIVFNDTRVAAARLLGKKETGGRCEALVISRIEPSIWQAMVKPGRRVQVGSRIIFDGGLVADVIERTDEGGRLLRFSADSDPDEMIRNVGEVPLPPYIHKPLRWMPQDIKRFMPIQMAQPLLRLQGYILRQNCLSRSRTGE